MKTKIIITFALLSSCFMLSSCNSGNTNSPPQNIVQETTNSVKEPNFNYFGPFVNYNPSGGSVQAFSQAIDLQNKLIYFVYAQPNDQNKNFLHIKVADINTVNNGMLHELSEPEFLGKINSASSVPIATSSVVDLNGNLYVAYYIIDGQILVNKYWKTSDNSYTYKQIAVLNTVANQTTPNNMPNGNEVLGDKFFKLALDNSNNLYIAYVDSNSNDSIVVSQFDDASGKFQSIGSGSNYPANADNSATIISTSNTNNLDMLVTGNDLVVAYQGDGVSQKLAVKKYNFTSSQWSNWSDKSKYYSQGQASNIHLAASKDNKLFVAFADSNVNNGDIVIGQLSGLTTNSYGFNVIGSGLSGGQVSYVGLLFDNKNGSVIASYQTNTKGVGAYLAHISNLTSWENLYVSSQYHSSLVQNYVINELDDGTMIQSYIGNEGRVRSGLAMLMSNKSKFVFVTKNTYSANMGGFNGADELCNQEFPNIHNGKTVVQGPFDGPASGMVLGKQLKWHAMLWKNPNYRINSNDSFYDVSQVHLITGPWKSSSSASNDNFLNINNNQSIDYNGFWPNILQASHIDGGDTLKTPWTGWSNYFPGLGNNVTKFRTTFDLSQVGPAGNGSPWDCTDWTSSSNVQVGSYGFIGVVNEGGSSYYPRNVLGTVNDILGRASFDSSGNAIPTKNLSWAGSLQAIITSSGSTKLVPVRDSCSNPHPLICVGPFSK